jgi:hypothetical protein
MQDHAFKEILLKILLACPNSQLVEAHCKFSSHQSVYDVEKIGRAKYF